LAANYVNVPHSTTETDVIHHEHLLVIKISPLMAEHQGSQPRPGWQILADADLL
jgi:hypothetical protein